MALAFTNRGGANATDLVRWAACTRFRDLSSRFGGPLIPEPCVGAARYSARARGVVADFRPAGSLVCRATSRGFSPVTRRRALATLRSAGLAPNVFGRVLRRSTAVGECQPSCGRSQCDGSRRRPNTTTDCCAAPPADQRRGPRTAVQHVALTFRPAKLCKAHANR